jgi:hypothetical protein
VAKQTTVVVTDDLDGSANAQTVTFGIDGKSYTIDVGKKNEAALRKLLATYVEAGRKVASEAPSRARRFSGTGASSRERKQALRAFWRENGGKAGLPAYNDRGRFPGSIEEAAEAAGVV